MFHVHQGYNYYVDTGNHYDYSALLKSLTVTGACHMINQHSSECGFVAHSLAGLYATNDVDRMLASCGVAMSAYDMVENTHS